MNFTPMYATALCPNVAEDFATATEYGGVFAGETALYVRQLLRTEYLPYSAITQAFLRQQQVKARLCCGVANMDQFYLVLIDGAGKEHQLHLDNREKGDILLQLVAQHQPGAKIGK